MKTLFTQQFLFLSLMAKTNLIFFPSKAEPENMKISPLTQN